MPHPARKLSLKRESLTELASAELGRVGGGDYSGNPFCILSITAPCVTFLSCRATCLATIVAETE